MIVVPERWSLAAISLRRAFAFLILPRAHAPTPLFAAELLFELITRHVCTYAAASSHNDDDAGGANIISAVKRIYGADRSTG
jgi:hypothetical protein